MYSEPKTMWITNPPTSEAYLLKLALKVLVSIKFIEKLKLVREIFGLFFIIIQKVRGF